MNHSSVPARGIRQLPPVNGAALVMGSAPSVRHVNPNAFPGIKIGVGDLPARAPNFTHYDYWVTANSYVPLPWIRRHQRAIKRAKYGQLIFATSAASPLSTAHAQRLVLRINPLITKYRMVVYDQRHLHGPCEPRAGCCEISSAFVHDQPIQKWFSDQTGHTYHGDHSVIFHALALSVLLGARQVIVAGVELPMSNRDYLYAWPKARIPLGSTSQWVKWRANQAIGLLSNAIHRRDEVPSMFSYGYDEMVSDLHELAQGALAVGSELINTSPTSLLREIDGIRQEFGSLR